MSHRHLASSVAMLGALLIVASLVSWVPRVPARAAFPGTPGRIAYDQDGKIYTIRPDGSGLRQLTFTGTSLNPAWSADGTKIAFNRGGDIFVMSATGRNVRRITTFGRSYQPAWSPDGTRIVFIHVAVPGQPADLWVVRVAGGDPWRLTRDAGVTCGNLRPVWSPRGGKIAFEQRPTCDVSEDEWNVVILTLSTRARTVIPNAYRPDFAANGSGLFFLTFLNEEGRYWPGPLIFWSTLTGEQREMLGAGICVDGGACTRDMTASPASAYAATPAHAWTEKPIDEGSRPQVCLNVTPWETVTCVFLDEDLGYPDHLDWQPIP